MSFVGRIGEYSGHDAVLVEILDRQGVSEAGMRISVSVDTIILEKLTVIGDCILPNQHVAGTVVLRRV